MKYIILLLLTITFSLDSKACSCVGIESIEKNWELADYVFHGEVVKVDSSFYDYQGNSIYLVTLKILEEFKNKYSFSPFRTFSIRKRGGCGYYFDFSKEQYLVYADDMNNIQDEGFMYASCCSRTDVYSKEKEAEINILRELKNAQKEKADFEIKHFDNVSYVEFNIVNEANRELKERVAQQKKIIWCLVILLALSLLGLGYYFRK